MDANDLKLYSVDELELYSVTETMEKIKASRGTYYGEVNSNRLKSVRRGRRRFHTASQIKEYLERLEKEAESERLDP